MACAKQTSMLRIFSYDTVSLYLCSRLTNYLLLVSECKSRARNTASGGSHFKFAEREVIFSMATWLTDRVCLELSWSVEDLGPVRRWRKKYFIFWGTDISSQPLGNEPSKLNGVSWFKTAVLRIEAAISNVCASSSGVCDVWYDLPSSFWTHNENSVPDTFLLCQIKEVLEDCFL